MPLTFKSKVGDVTMLDANAAEVLGILGKERGERGVITAAEAPACIAKLNAAVAAKGAERRPDSEKDPEAAQKFVPLRNRVLPMIEMLERAHAANADVLWGV
jgi:hypothetical protein